MMNKVNVEIKNKPASLRKYTVVRFFDHELWFYGSFDEADRAETAANEIENGLVLEVVE